MPPNDAAARNDVAHSKSQFPEALKQCAVQGIPFGRAVVGCNSHCRIACDGSPGILRGSGYSKKAVGTRCQFKLACSPFPNISGRGGIGGLDDHIGINETRVDRLSVQLPNPGIGRELHVGSNFHDASIADDPEMLERFLREAQSAAAVRGSHVVQIFDCGVDGRDPYIAMEQLQGETLDERLTARGRLTPGTTTG